MLLRGRNLQEPDPAPVRRRPGQPQGPHDPAQLSAPQGELVTRFAGRARRQQRQRRNPEADVDTSASHCRPRRPGAGAGWITPAGQYRRPVVTRDSSRLRARAAEAAIRDDVVMSLQLAPEEPEAGPWRAEPLTPVVHTDDIAWHHSRFGWADLLVDGILLPARHGSAVTFQPPRRAEHGRTGTINVPAYGPLLIIEGVGAGRRETACLADALMWVQNDQREATRRSLARAGQAGAPPLSGPCVRECPRKTHSWLTRGRGNGRIPSPQAPCRFPVTRSPNLSYERRHHRRGQSGSHGGGEDLGPPSSQTPR